uniref:Uncharacterized protein n=1 Tax=Peromyscus maniculatus bairdii TaxID=230844 RepID=A0A8C8UCT0_PERMB
MSLLTWAEENLTALETLAEEGPSCARAVTSNSPEINSALFPHFLCMGPTVCLFADLGTLNLEPWFHTVRKKDCGFLFLD